MNALVIAVAWLALDGTAAWAQTGSRFVPVTPCRVADTRNTSGPFGGPTMAGGQTRSFAIPQSPCGIPATAQAYSLNVTVVPNGPLGYLSLWPTGQAQPGVSTLNSWGGTVVANAAIVPAGTSGAVSVFVSNPTDVILDINGYFTSTGSANSASFYPVTPCRVADTRNPAGQFGGPTMTSGQTRNFPIPQSPCGVPTTASAYAMNVTVVPDGPLGFLTTWPTGQALPNTSTLNSWTGKVLANAALVPAGTNEAISVFASNPTDVILDINGYFGQPGQAGGLSFFPVTPCRVADTRNASGPFGGPEMAGGTTRSFAIPTSNCNVPSTAAAYSVNVTVVPDGPLGYLSAWPAGASQPNVSTLNSWDGSVAANAAIIPAGTNAAIDVFVTNNTNVILDINGYFASTSASDVAERALAQTGLSIALASNVLQSQMYVFFLCGNPTSSCQKLSGGGSVQTGSTPSTSVDGQPIYPVNVYYDSACTQPYIAAVPWSLTDQGDGNGLIQERATYYGPTGSTIGTMTLNETVTGALVNGNLTGVEVHGLGVFTPASGLVPVQLGLSCVINSLSNESNIPCEGGVAQDFPALNLAIGSVTSLTLDLVSGGGGASSVSFSGGGSTFTGLIGDKFTLTNPSPASFVIQDSTAYTATTASGSAAGFSLFPPTPTSWTLTDAAHDQQFVASVIDNTTRNTRITITQISTANTLASGTLDPSGTGTITYSDGSMAAITGWTLAD
jgi:hypothetical protein